MAKAVVGMDIGSCNLKLAVCDAGGVRRLVTEPLPDQLVRDGRVASPEAMASFLRETAAKNHLSVRRCAVVLPAAVCFTKRTTMPAMTVEQLKLNLPYEFRDYITQEKDKYFYDYALLNMEQDEAGKPRQMELMAAAALKSTIHDYEDLCRWAGFRLLTAVPEEFAYSNLIRGYIEAHPERADDEYCIIDLGHTATRVYIFTGRRLEASRVVESGGALLDGILAESFHVDEHLARTYKLTNQNGELELEACRSVYRAIAVEIMRAINFYGYNSPGSKLKTAWLCGGGSNIAPLVDQLRETLALELQPIAKLLTASGADPMELALCAAAVGVTQQ